MVNAAKNRRLLLNSSLWILAMALPAFFYVALATAKFPWPIVMPLLLIGPMLISNKFVAEAGERMDDRSDG
jgi:hypothetical protein